LDVVFLGKSYFHGIFFSCSDFFIVCPLVLSFFGARSCPHSVVSVHVWNINGTRSIVSYPLDILIFPMLAIPHQRMDFVVRDQIVGAIGIRTEMMSGTDRLFSPSFAFLLRPWRRHAATR
jgi:hypothetical protein